MTAHLSPSELRAQAVRRRVENEKKKGFLKTVATAGVVLGVVYLVLFFAFIFGAVALLWALVAKLV